MSLLDEAKKKNKKKGVLFITDEHMELAEAYLKGEISLMAIASVIGKPEINSAYLMITRALRQSYLEGRITIDRT